MCVCAYVRVCVCVECVECVWTRMYVSTYNYVCVLFPTQIFLWTFRDNKDIVGVTFIDTKLYIHSVACIRNFILVADPHQSAMLMQYRVSLNT